MEKNNKILYVILIILVILVLLLGGYIVYEKKANTNKDNIPNQIITPETPEPEEQAEEEEPAALSIINKAEEILSNSDLYNTFFVLYQGADGEGLYKGNMNDVPNQAKLQFVWLHFKNEFEKTTSDKMLKYAQSIFGKDFTIKFEDFKDFYATGINNKDKITKLSYVYNKNTKKYSEYCDNSGVCGGHGILYPLGDLIKYELVDSRVENNKYLLTYKQLFYDPSGFMHRNPEESITYSITNIFGKEMINKKLGFILGNKAKELDETEIIEKETELLPLSITKEYNKIKDKLPNVTYTFEKENDNLILKSINY